MNISTCLITILLTAIFYSQPINAQDGTLDMSFGINGYVTTPIGFTDESGKSVAIQSDGKIVVGGSSKNGLLNEIAVVRYNIDGSLDSTFDSDGKVTTPVGAFGVSGNALAIQADGKIVVLGNASNGSYNDFALVRFNTDGSLDTTFDHDGMLVTDVGIEYDNGVGLVIQSDGKIVASGTSHLNPNSYFTLLRYNTDGSLDTTFDHDGIDTLSFGNQLNWGYSTAIQADGKIVIVGLTGYILGWHTALIRVNTDGSLDSTFDSDGKLTIRTDPANEYDGAYAIAIQPDGKIVTAGINELNADDDFAIVRLNSDGSMDSTFDADGVAITSFGMFDDTPNSIAVQSDGKIIAAGYSTVNWNYQFAMARYNSDGSQDTTFDADGKVSTLLRPNSSTGWDMALQNDGKIVMVGDDLDSIGWQNDFAVARFNNTIINNIHAVDKLETEVKIYPNPFSGTTVISFSLSQPNHVFFKIFNAEGRLVSIIPTGTDNMFPAGENTITWNADDYPAGIYFLRMLVASDSRETPACIGFQKLIVTQ